MDLRRLRAGEWIATFSGAALIVSLFLPWYGGRPRGGLASHPAASGADATAWQAFSVLDVVFFLGGLLGVALLLVTATQKTVAVPVAFTGLTVLAAAVVLLLVVLRLLFEPGDHPTREGGLFLALAGAVGLTGGGLLALRDERLSKPGRPTDATGRPAPPGPEIEPIPAPRP
jgi:hypothetical protein